MKLLEVGNLGGDLSGLGMVFLFFGLVIFVLSIIVTVILGIMRASNSEKKYDFKLPLIGVLIGVLIFTAGGFICGFNL